MGYCVRIEITDIRILAEKVAECLAAINAMHDPATMRDKAGGGSTDGSVWYSFTRNPPESGFRSLVNAFEAWRYDAFVDEDDGSVVIDCFDGEKWGDDEQLFQTIAPFVEGEGLILVRGEDGAQWRYTFNNGEMTEQTAKIVWSRGHWPTGSVRRTW